MRDAEGALSVRAALLEAVPRLRPATARPRLEAELLLAHLLDRPRAALLAHPEAALTPEQAAAYARLVARRAADEPLPYITGSAEFYGRRFAVTPDVLIPRPETELLVERSLAWLAQRPGSVVVDVGSGSGCIVVSLATHAPAHTYCATDIAAPALRVARDNALRHAVAERIAWVRCDLLAPLARADLIVSNPPYVTEAEWAALPASVRREPRGALLAGPDGLDVLRCLLAQARTRLRPGGLLLAEIGERQGEAARALARAALVRSAVRVLPDLAGKDRVLEIRRDHFAQTM